MKSSVLYIAFVREDSEATGFVKKIHSQSKAFSNLGFSSYLYITTASHAKLYEISEEEVLLIKSTEYTNKSKYIEKRNIIINKFASYYRFNEFLSIIQNDLKELDVNNLYFRRMKPITFKLIKFLKYIKSKDIKVFYEYPDYPVHKPNTNNIIQNISHIYDLQTFKILKKYIDFIVGITYKKINPSPGLITIKNGININTTPLKKNNNNQDINLVCVANLAHWHAYDRVLKGMKIFYENNTNKNIFFHIIGEGNEKSNLKKMVKNLDLTEYVKFYGIKTGKELNDIIDKCDIGIGALGTHRINIQGNSSLKNREYCARGLPFILAGEDYDFNEDFKYKMQISSDESSLNINEVIKFYFDFTNNGEDYSRIMREFASTYLTWESKLKPIVKHFN